MAGVTDANRSIQTDRSARAIKHQIQLRCRSPVLRRGASPSICEPIPAAHDAPGKIPLADYVVYATQPQCLGEFATLGEMLTVTDFSLGNDLDRLLCRPNGQLGAAGRRVATFI